MCTTAQRILVRAAMQVIYPVTAIEFVFAFITPYLVIAKKISRVIRMIIISPNRVITGTAIQFVIITAAHHDIITIIAKNGIFTLKLTGKLVAGQNGSVA